MRRIFEWVMQRGAALTLLWIGAVGCGGIPTGETMASAPRAPIRRGVTIVALAPMADVVLTSAPRWAGANLSGEPWLMAGADDGDRRWMSCLAFDLSPIGDGVVRRAVLLLPVLAAPVMPGRDDASVFEVIATDGAWSEEAVTWGAPPRLVGEAIATVRVERMSTEEVDSIDLTMAVEQGRASAGEELRFCIRPVEPAADFRRRWTEGSSASGDPSVPRPSLSVELEPSGIGARAKGEPNADP